MTVNMKNAALFVFIALLGFAGYAQVSGDTRVDIPEGPFKEYLKTLRRDDNGSFISLFGGDGYLTFAEAAAYTDPIDLSSVVGDLDLTGLEAFVSIISFNCAGIGLSGLDLRKNVGLTSINCSNSSLKWLKLGDIYSTLTSLDVSGNADLGCIQVSDVAAAQTRVVNNALILTMSQSPPILFCAMDDTPLTYEFVADQTGAPTVTTVYGNTAGPITIYVKFSEALLGGSFVSADVNLNGGNGLVAGLESVPAVSNLHKFTYDPGDASTSVSISAGAVTDVYGNTNSVGTPVLTVIRDTEAPTVVVTGTGSNDDVQWVSGVATLNINIDDDNFDFSSFDLAGVISVQSAPGRSIIIQTVKDPTNSKHYTVTLTITDSVYY